MTKMYLIFTLVFHLAMELFRNSFWRPSRIFSLIKAMITFKRADKESKQFLAPIFAEVGLSVSEQRRYLRYSRNTLALVAIQPHFQQNGWKWPRRETQIAILYGISIPLYDDNFDEQPLEAALQFSKHFSDFIQNDYFSEKTDITFPCLHQQLFQVVLNSLLQIIPDERREGFQYWANEMHFAQIESLAEHDNKTTKEKLQGITARKASASLFFLLASVMKWDNQPEKALQRAAIWAQYMDDYDDLESDLLQGSITFIAHLEREGTALPFIREELLHLRKECRERYNWKANFFCDVLTLNLIVKVAHKKTIQAAIKQNVSNSIPRFYWKGEAKGDTGARKNIQ
jgi:hypothetical protein